MTTMKRTCLEVALVVGLASGLARAGDTQLKPFVLAYRSTGDLARAAEEAKAKLIAAGFEVAGTYAPYEDAVIVAVTSAELKAAAAKSKFSAYAAAQRVTLTRVGDEIQVAYTNPVYMQHAYRMKGDLAPVAAKLEGALGRVQAFGSDEGKTAEELRDYHYMVGMQKFDAPSLLGRFDSHYSAVKAVEAGLAAGKGGAKIVYQVDVPATSETVFGVALREGCSGDEHIMKEIDFKPLRSTGHLPYEILVSGPDVFALYGRFRIAINFTDLKMMGSHSFMNIRCAPGAIEEALKKVASPM